MIEAALSNRLEMVERGARLTLALLASSLACHAVKPGAAEAHIITDAPDQELTSSRASTIGSLGRMQTLLNPYVLGVDDALSHSPTASDTGPFDSNLETVPVTIEELDSYMDIAKAESPNSPCNAPKNGKTHGFNIRLLPAFNETSPADGMLTLLPDGTSRVAMARSNGKCNLDFLNFRIKGSQGKYDECAGLAHEGEHEDISRSPIGYVPPESEQDPTGRDKTHNFVNSHSLMFVKYLIPDYEPCKSITTDLEPPLEPSTPGELLDYSAHGIDELAQIATDYIPRFKKAIDGHQAVGCTYIRRSPKTPEFSRRLCYSQDDKDKVTNASIITIRSQIIPDGKPNGRPNFTSAKMSNKAAQRTISSGSLRTSDGKRAYREANTAKKRK